MRMLGLHNYTVQEAVLKNIDFQGHKVNFMDKQKFHPKCCTDTDNCFCFQRDNFIIFIPCEVSISCMAFGVCNSTQGPCLF